MLLILSLHLQSLIQNVHLLLEPAYLHSHGVDQLSLLAVNCTISRDLVQPSDFCILFHQLLVHSSVGALEHIDLSPLLLHAFHE